MYLNNYKVVCSIIDCDGWVTVFVILTILCETKNYEPSYTTFLATCTRVKLATNKVR